MGECHLFAAADFFFYVGTGCRESGTSLAREIEDQEEEEELEKKRKGKRQK